MEMILMVISLQVIRRKIGSLSMIQKKLQGLLRIVERRSLSPVKRIEDSKYAEGLISSGILLVLACGGLSSLQCFWLSLG